MFDELMVEVESILLPPELDFFGLGAPAQTSIGATSAAVKGNVDVGSPNNSVGTLLATITLTDLASIDFGTYVLTLADNKNALEDDIFVDGSGTTRDNEISFGSATINVVPEPSGLVFVALAIIGLVRHWKRCK